MTNFTDANASMQEDDDRNPQILYGAAAHENNATVIAAASKQNKNEEEATGADVISSSINHEFAVPCATWKTDEDVEFDNAVGVAYLTNDALLFQCSPDYSVSIDAECILLHAQAEDDKVLYLQLCEPSSISADSEVMEMTLTLESATACKQLFEALSQLVSLHPVYDDDDDPNDTGGGMMMMMGMNGPEENYGDDMIVAAAHQQQDGDDANEGERNAMLDRLDNMLTVPPHLEHNDDDGEDGGQFDDAEDDVDRLL